MPRRSNRQSAAATLGDSNREQQLNRTPLNHAISVRTPLSALCALTLVAPALAQTNQTVSPIPGTIPSSERNWGMPVNGICAEAAVLWESDHTQLPSIVLGAINTNANGFNGPGLPVDESDVFSLLGKAFTGQALYFAPTNIICGPVVLRDAKGMIIPPLKPEALSPESYPASFSISDAKQHNPHPRALYPHALVSSGGTMSRFHLADYFPVSGPGQYQLAAWPKIYQRPSTNSDACYRVDLPPVSVTIEWHVNPNRAVQHKSWVNFEFSTNSLD